MKSLREEAEKRINEKMEGIDTARTDALDAIAAEVEVSFFFIFFQTTPRTYPLLEFQDFEAQTGRRR